MKNTQTANEALIDYILHLTPEQVNKVLELLPLLKQMLAMSANERIFAETFLGKVCGKVSA